jgi:alkanesulfonate monooxygenase SsuD/methylene tetrahydromethanopterin reductase-like flavin-dependent oxidoreductase (luciferase family)
VLSAGISAAYVRKSLDFAQSGASQVGRDPKSLRAAGYVSFMASSDSRHAVDAVRQKLAFLFRNKFIDDNLAFTGIPIDQEAIIAAMSKRDYDAAARLVPDDAVEAFGVAGTVRQCCDKLQAFADAGLEDVVLFMAGQPADHRFGLSVIKELTH